MVNVLAVPTQLTSPLVYVGVTVMVAITGDDPVLIPKNELIVPVPLAPSPIEVVLLDQAYVVVPPTLVVPNVTVVVAAPLHTT